jgi:hypothetical protein
MCFAPVSLVATGPRRELLAENARRRDQSPLDFGIDRGSEAGKTAPARGRTHTSLYTRA